MKNKWLACAAFAALCAATGVHAQERGFYVGADVG